MSEAIIAKKAELVDVVAEKMKAAASIVVVDSRGLTVEQDTVLRRNLRGSEVEFKVIKNSILRRAAEKAGLEGLADAFVALATLPNREGLLSMLLSVLQAPVRNVALAVKAVADNKEDAA